jgi:hypothetical protein
VDGAYSISGEAFPDPDSTLFISITADVGSDVACDPPLGVPQILFPITGQKFQEVVDRGVQSGSAWVIRSASLPAHETSTCCKRGLGRPNYGMLVIMWALRLTEHFLLARSGRVVTAMGVLVWLLLRLRR